MMMNFLFMLRFLFLFLCFLDLCCLLFLISLVLSIHSGQHGFFFLFIEFLLEVFNGVAVHLSQLLVGLDRAS